MDVIKFPALEKVEVAKRMVADKDYVGARSHLLELHYLYPYLGNIPQMITVCDVFCASELTSSDSEIDWYWVLQLSPVASVSQIRSQHKKLVAILEAIKDEFPGAVNALKLVNDAYFILSDPTKRLVFNSKRPASWSDCEATASPVSSVDNAGSHSGKSLAKEQDTLGCDSSVLIKTEATNAIEAVGEKGSDVIKHEELGKLPKEEEVQNIDDIAHEALDVCWPNDGVSSVEVNSVSSSSRSMPDNKAHSDGDVFPLSSTTYGHEDDIPHDSGINSEDMIFEVGQIWAAFDDENLPRRYARINSISEDSTFRLDVAWLRPVPETENEEKWCEAGLPVVCGLFNLHEDEELIFDKSTFSHWVSYTANPTYDEFRINPQEEEIWAIYEDWRPFEWCDNPESRNGCSYRIIQILYLKEEESVLVAKPVKFDESQNISRMNDKQGQESFEIPLSCFYRFSHRIPSSELKEIEKAPALCESLEPYPLSSNTCSSNFSTPQSIHLLPSLPVSSASSLKGEWTAVDFTSGQVWAIYDGPDQMPRRYVVVNNLVSNRIVSVNLLEPHPMREEEICWVEENLPLGCGIFRVNPTTATLQMSKFSHSVNCDRSNKQSFYRVFPRKGEVWAMYRNWNCKWKKHEFDRSHCRIVQITSDFCEQSGVQVASLEQVPGFKTFFQKQLCDGFALNRTVRRTEMLSFSHRIEAFVVPGIQAHGIPECSWHLEPDALPLVISN